MAEIASFSTFSAHSVYMNKDINTLSADYPGPYLDIVEGLEAIDFASFAPGATGSHTPIGRKPFEHSKMLGYSGQLAEYFKQVQLHIEMDTTSVLKHFGMASRISALHISESPIDCGLDPGYSIL